MKWAILALTRDGTKQALRVKAFLGETAATVYTLEKWCHEEDAFKSCRPIEGRLTEFTGRIFAQYHVLVFIMATGIVVRSLGPHLGHKTTDPAVLVMDEGGHFVISLLSGHIGGANRHTKWLAERMGAQAVITTASDVKGAIAVDTLAEEIGCAISDMEAAKRVTARIVNGDPIAVINDAALDMTHLKFPENMVVFSGRQAFDALGSEVAFQGQILISNCANWKWTEGVQLIPKNLAIGIGCRKAIDVSKITAAILETAKAINVDVRSIHHFATVDLKADEMGILKAADDFAVPLKIIGRDAIAVVEADYVQSDFVKSTIGVGAVAEPCAMLSAGDGRFLMRKRAFDGVTVAVVEMKPASSGDIKCENKMQHCRSSRD